MGKIFTFTSCGKTGPTPPGQSDVNLSYANTSLQDKVVVSTPGIQEWVVPSSGKYLIKTYGAQGGKGCGTHDSAYGGRGACMSGEFMLKGGSTLLILVGQKGTDHPGTGGDGTTGAGGGGTYVAMVDVTSDFTFVPLGVKVKPLIISAGGNGGRDVGYSGASVRYNGVHTPGTTSFVTTTYSGGGFDKSNNSHNTSGKSFLLGGACSTNNYSRGGTSTAGFGGGGANRDDGDGGGGGGYNGGSPTVSAGSFNSGENQINQSGVRDGDGLVIIEAIGSLEKSGEILSRAYDVSDLDNISSSRVNWNVDYESSGSYSIQFTHAIPILVPDTLIGYGNNVNTWFRLPGVPTRDFVISVNGTNKKFEHYGVLVKLLEPPKGITPETWNLSRLLSSSGTIMVSVENNNLLLYADDGVYRLREFLQEIYGNLMVEVKGGIEAKEDYFDTSLVETYWSPTFSNKVKFKGNFKLYKVKFKPMVSGDYILRIKDENDVVLSTKSFQTSIVGKWEYIKLDSVLDVSIGKPYIIEFTRPTGALYASNSENYNGELWSNEGSYIGTFWGENYTIAMGFVFLESLGELTTTVQFSDSISDSGLSLTTEDSSVTITKSSMEPAHEITLKSTTIVPINDDTVWENFVNDSEPFSPGSSLLNRFLVIKTNLDNTNTELGNIGIPNFRLDINNLSTILKVL